MLRVEVVWIDSGESRDNGWESKDTLLKYLSVVPVTSVGYLMHEADDMIIIAQSFDSKNEHYYNIHAIWRNSIKSISTLRARKEFDGTHRFEEDGEGTS